MPAITQSLAMAVGIGGAMIDVSAYANLDEGVERTWGRESEFDDTPPGEFTFTLDNLDGMFTPDNASSSLATKVTEGMVVCWQIGTRLVSGTIRSISPMFPGDVAAWSQIRITCQDMLGVAARTNFGNLSDALVLGSSPFVYWPMNEASGSEAQEVVYGGPTLKNNGSTGDIVIALGGSPTNSITSQTEMKVTGSVGIIDDGSASPKYPTFAYGANKAGSWGFWFTFGTASTGFLLTVRDSVTTSGLRLYTDAYVTTGFSLIAPGGTIPVSSPSYAPGSSHYVSITTTVAFALGTSNFTSTLTVDGVVIGAATGTYAGGPLTDLQKTPIRVSMIFGNFLPAGSYTSIISHLAHTPAPVPELSVGPTTEANRLTAIVAAIPSVTLAALPSALSTWEIGTADLEGQSGLDAINDVIRTEQGYIYTTTTGSIVAPVQSVVVRERTRPQTVAYTFDVERELSGAPSLIRDLTNLVSSVAVEGVGADVTVKDVSLQSRAGGASTSETTLLTKATDLTTWGQDRLQRGANIRLRVSIATVDGFTTPTDRTADLLAMVPGDRIRFTGLPAAQLGFTSWDGWFLGATETQNSTEHSFEMCFQPVLPDTGLYDSYYYMADGDLSLSANLTAVAGTMSVATLVTTTKLETTTFPYDLIIDSEQVTVTACTSATPQVATITRAVNGTTAAAHSSGALVEVAVPTLYAF